MSVAMAVPNQAGFAFPLPLTEKYRPLHIAEFIGLEKVKKILGKLVANPYPSAWLFSGPSGCGKTTMALALADEIPAELHHIASQDCTLDTVERICRTCWYVPQSGKRLHLILVDEADRMSDAAQVAFLSKLDATAFPPNTIFVFTCNSVERLEKRFLSRCRVLEFSSYGIASDAAELLQRIWDAETDDPVNRPDFRRIIKDATNNIRDAVTRLELEIMAA